MYGFSVSTRKIQSHQVDFSELFQSFLSSLHEVEVFHLYSPTLVLVASCTLRNLSCFRAFSTYELNGEACATTVRMSLEEEKACFKA